jgi:tRNA threonylcarbamoyladenosine biosynthesis protein TsaB
MRVGVAAGRGLAFAAGCPVLGVPTFDALAEAAPPAAATVACARDARRGEAWFALYGPRRDGGEREPLVPPCRRNAAAAAASLPAGCLVLGSFAADLASRAAAPGVRAGPPEGEAPAAAVLGRIGLARFLRDGAPDPSSVLPLYLQEPLAQRKGEGVRGG